MSLQRGTRLGPYQIESPIGAGGMGEVYKATDTRLERTVAIKVLPAHVASDPERKQRFEREAKTVAALSHPHICPVFDVGFEVPSPPRGEGQGESEVPSPPRGEGQGEGDASSPIDFLVMEYLEGETLADRLSKGALPLDQALKYAIEIADALDKAHRQGVTHRDLKPANIMLTKAEAKLLDFGLAKLTPTGPQSEASTKLADALTEQGTILGTFQYMAPEQLEGKNADARTDIWAFGCVVYEMVTGKRAFEGVSQASLIHAILGVEPPAMSSLQGMSPRVLDDIVRNCLVKDREDRWQSTGDLQRQLKMIDGSSTPGAALLPGDVRPLPVWRRAVPWLAGSVAGAVITGVVAWNLRPPESPVAASVTRSTITLSNGDGLALAELAPSGLGRPSLALSPDGAHLVYAVNRGGQSQLFLRPLEEREARPFPGTEGAFNPFFSPKGDWVAFFTSTQLKKISILGGTPETLCDATFPIGASWGSDDTIVSTQLNGSEVWQVSASGGAPELVLTTEEGQTFHWPHFLPEQQRLLITVGDGGSGFASYKVSVVSLDTGEQQMLMPRASGASYVPTGHLVYAGEGGVLAAPFDLATLTVTGAAAPVLDDVRREAVNIVPQLTFSASGLLAYVPGNDMGISTLVWVDRTGGDEPVGLPPDRYSSFDISPDGERLAIQIDGTSSAIWIYDFVRGTEPRRLTVGGSARTPLWMLDGRHVTYWSDQAVPDQTTSGGVFRQAIDGGQAEWFTAIGANGWPDSWSTDGVLTFTVQNAETNLDIEVVSELDSRESDALVQTDAREWGAEFSPDGRWIAYTSEESGQSEVYVKRYPPTEERWMVSTDFGKEAVRSPRGDELFYTQGGDVWSVAVRADAGFTHEPPQLLFRGSYLTVIGPDFAVAPDGRFLLLKEPEQPPPTQIHLVQNWFTELERLVPTP